MIELNKRQYEILTFMANTGVLIFMNYDDPDVQLLYHADLLEYSYAALQITADAKEMFRDAGLRRIN
jgi:hypothetical protein